MANCNVTRRFTVSFTDSGASNLSFPLWLQAFWLGGEDRNRAVEMGWQQGRKKRQRIGFRCLEYFRVLFRHCIEWIIAEILHNLRVVGGGWIDFITFPPA